MYKVLLIGSTELTGSIEHNTMEVFSTQNEEFCTKFDNISKKIFIYCLGYPVAPFPRNIQIMTLLWPKHAPNIVLVIGAY